MPSKTFMVPAISCHHCTHTIQNEVGELQGVAKVEADVASKQVKVEWDNPATWEQIRDLLIEIEYPAAE